MTWWLPANRLAKHPERPDAVWPHRGVARGAAGRDGKGVARMVNSASPLHTETAPAGAKAGALAPVRRHPLISFFVLAYALTWGLGALLRGEPIGLFSVNG